MARKGQPKTAAAPKAKVYYKLQITYVFAHICSHHPSPCHCKAKSVAKPHEPLNVPFDVDAEMADINAQIAKTESPMECKNWFAEEFTCWPTEFEIIYDEDNVNIYLYIYVGHGEVPMDMGDLPGVWQHPRGTVSAKHL